AKDPDMTTTPTAPRLRSPQVRALKALADVYPDGLTISEMVTKTRGGFNAHRDIGPARPYGRVTAGSLHALKLVRLEWHDILGHDAAVYFITKKGREVAETHHSRRRLRFTEVPTDVLDAAVVSFRPSRTYGFEQYDEAD